MTGAPTPAEHKLLKDLAIQVVKPEEKKPAPTTGA